MKKLALTFVVILLLMAGIGAGVYLIRQQTEFREKAAPSSSISLVPSKSNPNVNDTFTISADINTGTNQVQGVELHVTFDETKVEAVGATSSTFFIQPQIIGPSIDNNNGTLTYTVYTDVTSSRRQGQGSVAVFTFRAKAAGNTTIALSSESNISGNEGSDTATADDDNLLTGSNPAVLNILAVNQPTATPTSSSGSTSTPTPTPTTSAGGGTSTRTPTPTTVGNVSAATITPTSAFPLDFSPTPVQLPDSGVSIPTTLGIGLGVLVLVGSMLLAL